MPVLKKNKAKIRQSFGAVGIAQTGFNHNVHYDDPIPLHRGKELIRIPAGLIRVSTPVTDQTSLCR